VLQAFIDESGTNPETPILSVGGFYGDREQWDLFCELWEPRSVGFHARQSSDHFPEICSAIERSKINGILVTVSKRAYKEFASNHLKTVVGNAYSICAFMCILSICKAVENKRVSFVLEQGQPNLSFVKRTLDAMIDSGEWNIRAVASAQKSDFIELHTADFLSHVASSHDTEWMKRLFDAGRLLQGHITEAQLRETSPEITRLFQKARTARRIAKNNR